MPDVQLVDKLKELGDLKKQGLLTDDEFTKAKALLLAESNPVAAAEPAQSSEAKSPDSSRKQKKSSKPEPEAVRGSSLAFPQHAHSGDFVAGSWQAVSPG